MNEHDQQSGDALARQEARKRHWNDIVIPTAQALEAFLWRVAWFTVFLYLLRMFLTK